MLREFSDIILNYRLLGFGYKRIASELGLKRDDVRDYCKAHGLGGEGEYVKYNLLVWREKNNRCIICGKRLSQKKLGRNKRFCSGRCRTVYFRKVQSKRRKSSRENEYVQGNGSAETV